jgi:hypothetical protein
MAKTDALEYDEIERGIRRMESVHHLSTCGAKAREQLDALLRNQPMTLDEARKVLPSSKWRYDARFYDINGQPTERMEPKWAVLISRIDEDDVFAWSAYGIAYECPFRTKRKHRDAAETLFAAMQGDSPEAQAVREEYAR